MARFMWLLGFILGVLSQDDGLAQIAHDIGEWTRSAIHTEPED